MGILLFRSCGDFVYCLLVIILRVYLILSPVLALEVVPGSNCTAACREHFVRTNTTGRDITCYDQDYNSTAVGTAFKDCVSCELESETFDHSTNQTDLGWALCTYTFVQDRSPVKIS